MNRSKILLLSVALCFYQLSPGQKVEKGSDKLIKITGKVMNRNNDLVAGAVLYIDNLETNNVTDNRGTYKIKVSPSAVNLEVRSTQYGNSEVAINGQTTINFTLNEIYDEASQPLENAKGKTAGQKILVGIPSSQQNTQKKQSDDLQVNIGYGSVDRNNLTTPVTTVDARNSKYASYRDIYEILRELPGVIVSGNSVRILGVSSLNSGTQPLYVVDGMPVGTIDQISPSTVANISVLKGASTATFGARGVNGVILITLIRGSDRE